MNTITGNLADHIGETVQMNGSIYKIRKMKSFAFILIRTVDRIIQSVYSEEQADFSLEDLTEESCCTFYARVIAEERSPMGFELQLIHVKVLSKPAAPVPIVINKRDVGTSLDNLLNYRPITLRNEKQRTIFKIQAGIVNGMRQFFMKQNFTEIHTPKIVHAGAEGGANIFKLKYFGKEAYLAQSPQFYKQMMAGVFERVFEIGPVFRAEKHDTIRHLNEYTGIDFEVGFIQSFEDIMELETEMLKTTFAYLKENCGTELSLLNVKIPEINAIPSIPFMEAKKLIAEEYHREIKNFEDFEPDEEKLLCEIMEKKTGSEFVFVTHYPSKKRPFYAMDDPENPEVSLSFDLLFRGLEITTGGQRIHSYEEQIEKMVSRKMHPELFESYLMMHKYGMPPHGGLGLGLERFTARLLEMENVRYATLFPRDMNRLVP